MRETSKKEKKMATAFPFDPTPSGGKYRYKTNLILRQPLTYSMDFSKRLTIPHDMPTQSQIG